MYKVSKYMYIALAAMAVICGIMLTFNPAGFANSVCRIIGIIALAAGIMKTIEEKNSHTPMSRSSLCMIILGALLLIMPSLVLRFISMVAGVALIYYSLPRAKTALDDRKLGSSGWEVRLGLSVGGAVIGALMVLGGASLAHIIVRLLGIALIAIGGWMGFTLFKPGV